MNSIVEVDKSIFRNIKARANTDIDDSLSVFKFVYSGIKEGKSLHSLVKDLGVDINAQDKSDENILVIVMLKARLELLKELRRENESHLGTMGGSGKGKGYKQLRRDAKSKNWWYTNIWTGAILGGLLGLKSMTRTSWFVFETPYFDEMTMLMITGFAVTALNNIKLDATEDMYVELEEAIEDDEEMTPEEKIKAKINLERLTEREKVRIDRETNMFNQALTRKIQFTMQQKRTATTNRVAAINFLTGAASTAIAAKAGNIPLAASNASVTVTELYNHTVTTEQEKLDLISNMLKVPEEKRASLALLPPKQLDTVALEAFELFLKKNVPAINAAAQGENAAQAVVPQEIQEAQARIAAAQARRAQAEADEEEAKAAAAEARAKRAAREKAAAEAQDEEEEDEEDEEELSEEAKAASQAAARGDLAAAKAAENTKKKHEGGRSRRRNKRTKKMGGRKRGRTNRKRC
jgi:predicted RNA-binding protein with EMAP domain